MADPVETELVEMQLDARGLAALEMLQAFFNQNKFDAYTAMLIAGNLHAWVTLCATDYLGLDAVLAQLERSH